PPRRGSAAPAGGGPRREVQAVNHPLDALFRPRSVAAVGASRKRGSISGEIFHNLLSSGFPGPVYPVNPAAPSVQSVRAYPSVLDIPDEVDLAVVVVPQRHALATVEDCAKKGVRGIVLVTAGFAEMGEEGRKLQERIARVVRDNGMR